MTYDYCETEYSKKFASENPALFTTNLLEFIERHPTEHWDFKIALTKGFFTLSATRKAT